MMASSLGLSAGQLLKDWLPPSKAHYDLICTIFTYWPGFALLQFLTPWYPMGKTSIESVLNLPGKLGWFTMEVPGMLSLLYTVRTLPAKVGFVGRLPLGNRIMVGMFVVHYIHRAILSPLVLNPSMSPIHLFVWASALFFQLSNSVSLGAWIAGYGPLTEQDWLDNGREVGRSWQTILGFTLWLAGLLGNWYYDEQMRETRRRAVRERDEKARAAAAKERAEGNAHAKSSSSHKAYAIPQGGLFEYILYPHYLLEWIEWGGFWLFAGRTCVPAQTFLLNEVFSMAPRAWNGRNWYLEKFGKEKVGKRKAVVPWLF